LVTRMPKSVLIDGDICTVSIFYEAGVEWFLVRINHSSLCGSIKKIRQNKSLFYEKLNYVLWQNCPMVSLAVS
jgi:hypothetical protein